MHLSVLIEELKGSITDPEEKLGCEIVQKALVAPCRWIGNNAGVEGDVIVSRVAQEAWDIGYDAMAGEFGNLIENGVIDPKKVTRSGIQNSCSIAGMVLTTQAVVTEIPEKQLKGRSKDSNADTANAPGNITI